MEENIKICLLGTDRSGTNATELRVFWNTYDEIFIDIDPCDGTPSNHICLNRKTAIRLHKILRKEISFMRKEEDHGE